MLKNNNPNSLSEPFISVILPVYNGAKTIKRAVESILKQSYKNFEFIIVNDGSEDETLSILSSFVDKRIIIISQKNSGKSVALNRGIQESNGKYIAMIDADDAALPERFEKQVDYMEKNPSMGVVGTATREVYSDGTERIRHRPLDTYSIKRNIIRVCPFTHSSTMIRREVFDKVGLYDPLKDGPKRLSIGEDYDMWVRILAAGYDLANLPDVLTVYYRVPNSSIRGRPLLQRIKHRVLARIDIIKKLNLPSRAYLDIFPVILLSIIDHYGIRLDRIFNFLSSRR